MWESQMVLKLSISFIKGSSIHSHEFRLFITFANIFTLFNGKSVPNCQSHYKQRLYTHYALHITMRKYAKAHAKCVMIDGKSKTFISIFSFSISLGNWKIGKVWIHLAKQNLYVHVIGYLFWSRYATIRVNCTNNLFNKRKNESIIHSATLWNSKHTYKTRHANHDPSVK